MNSIPPEIILNVIGAVKNKEDLLSCACVCRQWSYHALEQLWYKPQLNGSRKWQSFFGTLENTQNTFPYPLFIRKLDLSPFLSWLEDRHLVSLIKCRRLERLILTRCYRLTDDGLCRLIDTKRGIGSVLILLDLSGVLNVTDRTISKVAHCCPKLQSLDLSMRGPNFEITDKSIVSLAKHCSNLKRIKLNYCVTVTERSTLALAYLCPHLVHIDLANCDVTDRAIQSLITYSRELQELSVDQCTAGESTLTENVLIQSALAPNYYHQLRIINLTGVSALTDPSIELLVQSAPRIKHLVLNKCFKLTDQAVLAISTLGRYLQYLHLGSCSRITDSSIIHLAQSCNRIQYLDLASCTAITDTAIVQLAMHLLGLKRIGLAKCIKISDKSIEALSMYCTQLERAHLSYCIRLSVQGITQLLERCRYINHLSLTNVPAFLLDEYQQFSKPPPYELDSLQSETFCVFSGSDIRKVRRHLLSIMQDV